MDPAQTPGRAVLIGGGVMGADVAAIFIAAGWKVQIFDIKPEVRALLPQRIQQAVGQIGGTPSSAEVVVQDRLQEFDWEGVRLVVECVSEHLAIKHQLFSELDALAPPDVPLASNSSSFPISSIGEGLPGLPRMLGLHFFMPAHLVPAVEVVRSRFTEETIVKQVSSIMRAVGKRPVQVKRDVPGFLANRIQHAMMREAIALVEEGFASAEDVDAAVRYGFGFRYVAAGPLLQKDLAGIDIHLAAATTMYPHLNNATEPSRLMRELVEAGNCGVKSPSRRGFYQWDDAAIAREQARYVRALQKALQILRDEEAQTH
jgi:3-hydroxybutyryl-CoA dehydrogenase